MIVKASRIECAEELEEAVERIIFFENENLYNLSQVMLSKPDNVQLVSRSIDSCRSTISFIIQLLRIDNVYDTACCYKVSSRYP